MADSLRRAGRPHRTAPLVKLTVGMDLSDNEKLTLDAEALEISGCEFMRRSAAAAGFMVDVCMRQEHEPSMDEIVTLVAGMKRILGIPNPPVQSA